MKHLFLKTILCIWIFSFLLIGCNLHQKDLDKAASDKEYYQELEKLKNEIATLKIKINELENEKGNKGLVAVGEEPVKDIQFENGKCRITVFFKDSVNSTFAFDILLTDNSGNTKIIIPMIEGKAISGGREYKVEFAAKSKEYRQLIIRAYELSTGRIWQKDWINSSDI